MLPSSSTAPPRCRNLRLGRPLDLRLTLGGLRSGHADPALRVGQGTAWRATHTAAGPATLAIEVTHMREVAARAWGPGSEAALDALPALLGEDDDDTALVPRHRVVAELQRRLRGMRMGRTGAVFEALVPVVLGQRVTSVEARSAAALLTARHGDVAPGPQALRLPPTPQRLAALPSWEYHRLGVERQRADTLRRAARVAGRLEEACALPRREAMARLRAVPGIGEWTSAHVAAAAFGDADAVPVGDYHIPHMVSWALAGEARGSDERMLELLEPYRGQRGRVVRMLVAGGVRAPRFGPRRPLRSIAGM